MVYEIVNTVNDMKYIGSTSETLRSRFGRHKDKSREISRNSKFYVAMRDIGVENFSIRCLEVVEYVDKKDLLKREFEYIAMYDKSVLYNTELMLGSRSTEMRTKLSLAHTGKICSDETRAKISLAHTGKTLSAERCAKMAIAQQKGGCIRNIEDRRAIRYQYCANGKDGKMTSKCFSYGPRSGRTKDEAMILAKALQMEIFPERFPADVETTV